MIYEYTVPQFTKALRNLEAILVKGQAFADSKKIEMSVLLNSRLAPDQFNLIRQVQIACDTAKLGLARISGKDAPKHDDKETTLAELRSRIQETIAYLSTITESDFAKISETKVTTPRWNGKWMYGNEFLANHVIPNLYFHITTAYSILRHNGVEIGKNDYLGEMPFKS